MNSRSKSMTAPRLEPGQVVTLKVARQTDLGAFLDAGTGRTADDILLHKMQQTAPVAVGEEVKVYLYRDPKGRLAASMRLPQMRPGQIARVKVINVTRDGAFVDIGAERGVFMPFAGMRGRVKRGDRVWVKLYTDKSGRPAVTMDVDEEIARAARPAQDIKIGDQVTGTIYSEGESGFFLFTAERYIAFLHKDEVTRPLRMGEEITVRVTYLRPDGRINVSMRPQKEDAIDVDAQNILAMLRSRGGKMPYSDDTAPEVIKEKFQISKAAFKRALGRLMKEGLVVQREGWTYLAGQEHEGAGKQP